MNNVSRKLINRLRIYTAHIDKKALRKKYSSYKTGTLLAKRNRSIAIMESVVRNTYIVIDYVKITTNELNQYKIIPLEWKFRDLKVGRRKVLYAQDMNEGYKTKSFVHINIQRVMIGRQKAVPSFPQKILRDEIDLKNYRKEKY